MASPNSAALLNGVTAVIAAFGTASATAEAITGEAANGSSTRSGSNCAAYAAKNSATCSGRAKSPDPSFVRKLGEVAPVGLRPLQRVP